MISRNKLYLPVWAIVTISVFGSFFILFALSCIIAIRKYRKQDFKIKTIENKDELLFLNDKSPIHKIKGKILHNGLPDGECDVYLKNGEIRKYDFQKGIIQRKINDKKDTAVFVINSDPSKAGRFAKDMTYQNKYGICRTLDELNPLVSVQDFIDNVNKNNDIKTIKLQLINHGVEDDFIVGNNAKNIANILDNFSKNFNGKNIVVNNFACYGAKKIQKNYEENENIENIVKKTAQKYKNINFIYQKHNDSKTVHQILQAYDDINDLSGISHFVFDYYHVLPDGTFKKIDKNTKYNLLNQKITKQENSLS